MVATESGIVYANAIQRLPFEQKWSNENVKAVKWVPWNRYHIDEEADGEGEEHGLLPLLLPPCDATTYVLTNVPSHLLTYIPTYQPTCLPAHPATYLGARAYIGEVAHDDHVSLHALTCHILLYVLLSLLLLLLLLLQLLLLLLLLLLLVLVLALVLLLRCRRAAGPCCGLRVRTGASWRLAPSRRR